MHYIKTDYSIRSAALPILILFSWFCLFPSHSAGQELDIPSGSSEYQFWYSGLDARSASLANSTIADPRNRSGIYSNPALIAANSGLLGPAFQSIYNFTHNIAIENLSFPVSLWDDKHMVIGTTIHHPLFSQPSFIEGEQLSFTQYAFDIAYSQDLVSSLSMGLKVQTTYGKTDVNSDFTANASFGFLYDPSPLVSYGIVYKGPGVRNETMGAGLIYYRPSESEGITRIGKTDMPHRVEIGVTLQFPSLADHPDFVLSFSNEKLFGIRGLIYRGGLEIFATDMLILRGGYYHSRIIEGARLGIGLLLSSLELDYAYNVNDLDQSGTSHQISVTLNL